MVWGDQPSVGWPGQHRSQPSPLRRRDAVRMPKVEHRRLAVAWPSIA